MKKILLFYFFPFALGVSGKAISQVTRADISRIYLEGERLYRSGNFKESLDYLKKESGNYINTSDSLMYLKIMNLANMYRSGFNYTTELETTLKSFLGKVNRYNFPEQKYSEVTSVYTDFQFFKEADKRFYDSVTKVLDYKNVASLNPTRNTITNYQKNYPNTFYSKELTAYVSEIDKTLAMIEQQRIRHEKDSTKHAILKSVGRKMVITAAYSVPTQGSKELPVLQNYNEVKNFFDGKYSGTIGEKYALNASFAETFINVYTGKNIKFAIDWNLFDAEYAVFDWNQNSFITDKESGGSAMKELNSIKAGTRIGPVIIFLLTKKIACGAYYSARPGIEFLLHTSYFTVTNGTDTHQYEIAPVIPNYNFTNEVGVKFYFFKRTFISLYLHFGNHNWKNDISEITVNSSSNTTQQVQTKYPFQSVGLRIGF
jgi:hypothetical protein